MKLEQFVIGSLAVVVVAASAPAHSQSPCEGIKSDEDRLKCYDAVAGARGKTTQPTQPSKEDSVIQKAKSAITRILKDPTSAKFEGIVKRPEAVCGFVNAKNSMGGYTGRKMFVYLIKENLGYILEVDSDRPYDALAAAEANCQGVPGF